MKNIFVSFILLLSFRSQADEVFKIDIGKSTKNYSQKELQKRVLRLEKAVWQLQQKVFQLQNNADQSSSSTWVCTLSVMGDNFSAYGGSRAVAKVKVIDKCTKKRGDDFFCKNPKCEK